MEATNVPEILREAGKEGMHVDEIAKRVKGVEPWKISHILRLLATHHLLREVSPDVFANNRVSSFLDTGKGWEEILSAIISRLV